MNPKPLAPALHLRKDDFLSALAYTAATTGFSQGLIEKDYFCTLILRQLTAGFRSGLIFKGGTSLSKVHAGFYRLSEDLDFAISVQDDAKPSIRRELMAPMKEVFTSIPDQQPSLRMMDSIRGHNQSKQYLGGLVYTSAITGRGEVVAVEISLRERVLTKPLLLPARTLLLRPKSANQDTEDPMVMVLSVLETYAEKMRAALSRPEPKIRDFYDIGHAVQSGMIDLENADLHRLVGKKLSVPGNGPIDISSHKFAILTRQLGAELKAVLRPADYDRFDLPTAYQQIAELARRLL